MEVIAELVAKLPEMEIDGVMSDDMEAKVWEKRMPDLEPAEQLAVEMTVLLMIMMKFCTMTVPVI